MAYSDERASKVIIDDNSTIYAVVIAGYDVAGTSDVSSTVYGGFSSDRQGLLQHSLVPLRSDHKFQPKASVLLRSGQTAMGLGRGVARDALASGEDGSSSTADDFTVVGRAGSGSAVRPKTSTADAITGATVSSDVTDAQSTDLLCLSSAGSRFGRDMSSILKSGYPDPVYGGYVGYFRSGESPASLMEAFRTADKGGRSLVCRQ